MKFYLDWDVKCPKGRKLLISTNKTIKRIVIIDFSYFDIDSSIVTNKYYLLNEIFAVIVQSYFQKNSFYLLKY